MTDIDEVIFSRRSIRWFKKDPLPDEDIREIISAGIRAPNAGGGEQWKFIILTLSTAEAGRFLLLKCSQVGCSLPF